MLLSPFSVQTVGLEQPVPTAFVWTTWCSWLFKGLLATRELNNGFLLPGMLSFKGFVVCGLEDVV